MISFLLPLFSTNVSAQQLDVNINASVAPCGLIINVKPEQRAINNWMNTGDFDIRTMSDNPLHQFNLGTDATGSGSINLCASNVFLTSGTYRFYVRGLSHLRKRFDNVVAFSTPTSYVDLSTTGGLLIAGETSNVYDNVINTLDLSTQIRFFGTGDIKNDLNRDGNVNFNDLQISLNNFYFVGD